MSTEERDELALAIRRLLAKRADRETVHSRADRGDSADLDLYAELASLGMVGLAQPESLGGQGGTIGDVVAVLVEVGAALAPVPLHSTALALAALEAIGTDEAGVVIREVVDDARVATVALSEGGAWDAVPRTRLHDGRLTGEKQFVLDADVAHLLIVSAVDDAGRTVLVLVDRAAEGVRVEPRDALDLTRTVSSVSFDSVAVLTLAVDITVILSHVLDVAAVLLAAEQVGGAQACLDLATEYAKTREQFGRPIGVHQAVKHPLADVFTLIVGSRALLDAAVGAAEEGDADELHGLALAVKAHASETYVQAAQCSIQMHGGIGMTWEHSAHLFLRRARSTEVLYGSPRDHREALITLVTG